MFTLNDDLSIYANRGDNVFFSLSVLDGEESYPFVAGDLVTMRIFARKDAANVLLEKEFPVFEEKTGIEIVLTAQDTKFGPVISKPTDYWYEIELFREGNTQTIVGYDEEGPKIFRLYPEGGA